MADTITNPTDITAVIVFDENGLKMVVPDPIKVPSGRTVKWVVVPPSNKAEVFFGENESPFDWGSQSDDSIITGTIQRDAKGEYKYSVRDGKGNIMDPRIQIKP
jgi:hypothetical protein